MQRDISPQQKLGQRIFWGAFWRAYLVTLVLWFCLLTQLIYRLFPEWSKLSWLWQASMLPAIFLGAAHGTWRLKKTEGSLAATIKRFVPRGSLHPNLTPEEFRRAPAIPRVWLWGMVGVLCAAALYLPFQGWQNWHSHHFEFLEGVALLGLEPLCFLALLTTIPQFKNCPILRLSPEGVGGLHRNFFWRQLGWEEIAGCELREERDYIGSTTFYSYAFKDGAGKTRLSFHLWSKLPLEEQKRMVESIERFL